MYSIKAESRKSDVKVAKLRKDGIVPGCIYGGKLEETMLLQFSAKEATKLMHEKSVGGQVSIDMDGRTMIALLKEAAHNPLNGRIEHLSFQSLVASEKVTSTAQIQLINEDRVTGIVRQMLFELSIHALPANLVEEIRIDLAGMSAGTMVHVEDLDIAKNPDVEVLTPLDTLVLSIVDESSLKSEEPVAEAVAAEAETKE